MKSVLTHLAIFAVGATMGFLVARKLLEQYYADLAQEEIDSVKEQFGKTRINTKFGCKGADDFSSSVKEASEAVQRMGTVLTRNSLDGAIANKYEQAKRNYNLIPSQDEDFDDDDEELSGGQETDDAGMTEQDMTVDPDAVYHERDLSGIDRTEPYLIDDREFSEEFDHHEKLSLYYYRVDDVLCDDHEEIVDDIEKTVGYDALYKLDMQTSCWVRNEPLCADYEIIAVNKSYAETVHGIGVGETLSPREKYIRQQRRREDSDES